MFWLPADTPVGTVDAVTNTTLAPWPPRHSFALVSFNSMLWVMGGAGGTTVYNDGPTRDADAGDNEQGCHRAMHRLTAEGSYVSVSCHVCH